MSTPDLRRIEVPESVLIGETAGEAVLLNLESEHYFGLTETGSVDADTLRRDFEALVDELLAAGLLEVADGQASPHP